ncbi:M81 family metallopeptidase [Marivita sp. S6314]|uniref:M81 family metallopeptidase n=1 Tax=Marivita sp. S6314 TaxID=2926406 RepID=UPI001FF383BE|nr:M81 family metallopeptidase [Marivita sp. S6314]MCK0150843.1 M81 family metallopeptidase [Marivita sp. S6314]
MKPRIALLGAVLESNRFAPPAERDDFTSLTWLAGADLMAEARSATPKLATEFAAFVRAMDATGDWEPVPCLLAASHPAGPVRQDVIEEIIATNEEMVRAAGQVDAVYICNHGAMVAEHDPDPDGLLMTRIREVVGPDVLIVATLDLHANVSERMVDACDLIVGYRTNPHVDQIERGEEAAFSLRRQLAMRAKPQIAHVKLPLVPSSVTLLSAEHPYGTLIDYGQRRQAEYRGQILNVSVFGNFLFSDTPDNGVSIVVTAREEAQAAQDLAAEIAELAWSLRADFVRELMCLDDAVKLAAKTDRMTVILSDAGDNPGGGGSGRTTALLAAFHEAGIKDCLVGSFCDPDLARDAHHAGIGNTFTARFNRNVDISQSWSQWDTPFEAEAEVLALHDGNTIGERGMTAGRRLALGPSAALRIGGITVVVITDRTQTSDPVFFHIFGLDIAAARTVVVKSRGHFRAGFSKWFSPSQVFEVDTAGLTSPIHDRWSFQHLPRPNHPMDEDVSWP